MNSKKIIKIKKIVVVFVFFALIFQPFFVLADEVDLLSDPPLANNGETSSDANAQGDVLIETGDVSVQVGLSNQINQNTVDNADVIQADEVASTSTDPNIQTTNGETQSASSTEKDLLNTEEEHASSSDGILSSNNGEDTPTSTADILINNNEFAGSNILKTNGGSGENTGKETGGSVSVDTGDIEVGIVLENDINKNDLAVFCLDCDKEEATSSEFNIENTNDSNLENEIEIVATSGENYIEENGEAHIKTGNIGIVSIIVNFINTNFIGNGKEFFVNIFDKMTGDVDISGYGEEKGMDSNFGECDGLDCQFNIGNNSTSTLNNKININVSTGSNVIATTTGGGVIETGDIDIVNDILNIANLNISGNEWFFAVVNIFGEMDGDVILPAFRQRIATEEATSSFSSEATTSLEKKVIPDVSSEFIISNQNNADLQNDLNVNADTGQNDIAEASSSLIQSGDIKNESKILNLINYNISGDFWKFARINIFGSWLGIINGLPPEYSYYEDEKGITIYNEFLDDPKLNEAYAQLAVDNYNIASTTNEININASTGDNSILHSKEASLIETGYIKIKNSLLNFLNSNFTGNNWEFTMLNVFGDWKGNLDFGQPELWINMSSSEQGIAEIGDYVTYTFIYGNNGDSTATNVRVIDDFNEEMLEVLEGAGGEENNGLLAWTLSNIPPNSQGSFSFTTKVKSVVAGKHLVENVSQISSQESDRNLDNNSTSVSFFVNGGGGVRAVSSSKTSLPSLSIVKTNDASEIVYPGDIINYKLTINNNGSKDALEVYVLDVMKNIDTNEEIHRDFWNLETVFAGEEIIIEYSLEITSDIESGTYINEATIEGFDSNRQVYISAIGSSRNKIINEVDNEILSPSLVMSRVSKSIFVNPGDLLNYEIIIANNGRGDAHGVELTETLGDFLTYLDSGDNNSSWKFDIIKGGAIKNIYYSVAVSDKAEEGVYESYLRLLGDNIESSFQINSIEIRKPEVLGVALGDMPDPIIEKRLKQDAFSEPSELLLGTKEIIKKDVRATETNLGEILGTYEEKSFEFTVMYKLYMFIIFLTLILIWIILILFRKGKEEKEKPV